MVCVILLKCIENEKTCKKEIKKSTCTFNRGEKNVMRLSTRVDPKIVEKKELNFDTLRSMLFFIIHNNKRNKLNPEQIFNLFFFHCSSP